MFLFSFEVDTLEIALKEQQDMLEKVFLVESSLSHKGVRQNKSLLQQNKIIFISETKASDVGKTETNREI